MQDSTQRTMSYLWLPLLLVFVLGASISTSISTSVCRAESQNQEIELESGYVPDSSDDDTSITGFMPVRNASNILSAVLNLAELLSPVSGSDAYPGCILHGPPVTNTPA